MKLCNKSSAKTKKMREVKGQIDQTEERGQEIVIMTEKGMQIILLTTLPKLRYK